MKCATAILLLYFLSGCGEKRYTRLELLAEGLKSDSRLEILPPKEMGAWARCLDYGEGCQETMTMSHRGITFICVRYEKSKQAIRFGQSIDGLIVRNWLLDDVTGEPILEEFARRAWMAKKARSY